MYTITDIIKFLKGKKTYIVAAIFALVVFAESVGWLDSETATTIKGLLLGTGLITLRAGVAKR